MSKVRVTVSVDEHLADAGAEAVRTGTVESMSAWVNEALAQRVATERRLRALADAVAAFEGEHGTISPDELAAQARHDRDAAAASRRRRSPAARPQRR